MPRAKGGAKTRQRHKKILKMASGMRAARSRLFRTAREQVYRGLKLAYRERKRKKREYRALWITRINAAARLNGLSYSRLINGLKKASVEVDRKMLADLAVFDAGAFAAIAKEAKAALSA